MKLTLLLILFLLFWVVLYIFFRVRTGVFTKRFHEYVESTRSILESMFYQLSEKSLRRVLFIIMLGAGIAGFLLPGKVSQIEKLPSIQRAIELNKNGNYKKAVLTLEELKGLDSPLVHNELGVAYMGMDNYDQAKKELKRAVKILPEYSKAHFNLAMVYSRLGKNVDASFELSRAKESSKYTILQEDLYGLSGSIWDTIFLRLLLGGIFAYCGYRVPRLIINFFRRRRINRFDDQLADGLIMGSNGLRAGFSMLQAFDMISKEARPPLSQEFGLLLKEHRLGYELDEALRHLSERMPTTDTRIFVNSILILRETGGNLTEIFDTISETIQERKRVQKKIKTMTAEGETQAVILSILPIALGFILGILTPEVFSLMYTTFLGWMLIILMLFMEVAGLFWMLKIARVKI